MFDRSGENGDKSVKRSEKSQGILKSCLSGNPVADFDNTFVYKIVYKIKRKPWKLSSLQVQLQINPVSVYCERIGCHVTLLQHQCNNSKTFTI